MEIKLKKLLKISEAAELLGISTRTLYAWSASGRVPSVKINGVLRFEADEINEWINGHKRNISENLKDSKVDQLKYG